MNDASTRIPESEWKWYGYAGHLCVSRDCAYHLCTRIGNILVSTIGAYNPLGQQRARNGEMEKIGIADDAFFETFVFVCFGEDRGDPVINNQEIDSKRYPDSRAAEEGHYTYCNIYADREMNRRASTEQGMEASSE